MKAFIGGLFVLLFVASTTMIGTASAVTFDRNYSDPASDVVQLWTANMTPVFLPDGNVTMSPFPDSVNLLWIRSTDESASVNLSFQVKGRIADLDNTSYEMRLYTRADNASHFTVTYTNRSTILTSNATGFVPVDLSGNSRITSTGPNPVLLNTLIIAVSKSLLGAVTSWDIDATATQRGPMYTYRDSGWLVPGSPGSAPPPPQSGVVLPNWLWLAIAPVIVAIVVAVVIMIRHQTKRAPRKR
ncbi:MAG TPA: hypothetical protein VEM77_08630 [Thermoplasmata archaeon]|nr:hypothetical protein [Thermoplasmata archaeon]